MEISFKDGSVVPHTWRLVVRIILSVWAYTKIVLLRDYRNLCNRYQATPSGALPRCSRRWFGPLCSWWWWWQFGQCSLWRSSIRLYRRSLDDVILRLGCLKQTWPWDEFSTSHTTIDLGCVCYWHAHEAFPVRTEHVCRTSLIWERFYKSPNLIDMHFIDTQLDTHNFQSWTFQRAESQEMHQKDPEIFQGCEQLVLGRVGESSLDKLEGKIQLAWLAYLVLELYCWYGVMMVYYCIIMVSWSDQNRIIIVSTGQSNLEFS